MGRNLTNLYISSSFQFLTQVSGSELQDGLGNKITGSLDITSSKAEQTYTQQTNANQNHYVAFVATTNDYETLETDNQLIYNPNTNLLTVTASFANSAISASYAATASYFIGGAGSSGTSGINGTSGTSGANGTNGTSGVSGVNGTSGTSGLTGTSGTSGAEGSAGAPGTSGTSGANGATGTSGTSGDNGAPGTSGTSGQSGAAGTSGTSGANGVNGTSGTSGNSGTSGTSFTSPYTGSVVITGSLTVTGSVLGNLVGNNTDTYTSSAAVQQIVTLTQAEYNAIGSPDSSTLYIISGSTPINLSIYATTGSNTFIGAQVFSSSVRGEVKTLTISSNTASLDCSLDNFFTLTLVSGSTTHINPTNIQPGQTINLLVNPTGSGLVSFPSTVKQVSGSAYMPTTGSGTLGKDIVTFISFDSTNLYMSNVKNLV